jgi:hypothetical protein
MKKLHVYGFIAALAFGAVTVAQEATAPQRDSSSERVTPGETPTKDEQKAVREVSAATSSTKGTEGAASENTPSRDAPPVSVRSEKSPDAEGAGEEFVGAPVVTRANAPLGRVTEVVFDSKQQPAFVIISTEDQSSAVPYAAASSMMSDDKVVIDQSKLKAAPKLKEGEWKQQSSAKWQADAARYWGRG